MAHTLFSLRPSRLATAALVVAAALAAAPRPASAIDTTDTRMLS
jgi:hypothetical protein